jgi:two-component system sensor histidine kinase UhpB
LQRHLRERVHYDIEYRLCTRSGAYRWFRARGQAIWNTAGSAVRMAGSIHDIHEEKKTQQELHRAQERELHVREEFAQQLMTAQENERQRLANELHDSVGQNLSLIKNRAYLAQREPGMAASGVTHMEAIIQITSQAISEVRTLAKNLRPLHIEQLGLTESLEAMAEQVSQSGGLVIDKHLENVDDVLQGAAATHVYRIVQEALNNVMKHSRAKRVRVELERDLHCVRLRLSDDGCGFDVALAAAHSGLGLASITERARMLGGVFQLESGVGRGTTLKIELPVTEDGDSYPRPAGA